MSLGHSELKKHLSGCLSGFNGLIRALSSRKTRAVSYILLFGYPEDGSWRSTLFKHAELLQGIGSIKEK